MKSIRYGSVLCAILISVMLMLLGGCVATKEGSGQKSAAANPNAARFALEDAPKTLAILPFENNSVTEPELYQPLTKGLSAMLITDLSKSGSSLKLIERTKIEALLKEITLGQTGVVDQATAVKVGRILGAESIAFGAYMVLGDAVRIDVRIIKVETSELVFSESITGNSKNFMALEGELAEKIAETMRIVFVPAKTLAESNIEGALVFSQGVDALDSGDTETAQKLFEKSVQLDPLLQSQVDSLAGTQ